MRWLAMLALTLLLPVQVSATPQEWQEYATTEHSYIAYRSLPSGVTELKAELTTTARLGSFLHLLENTASISDWVPHAEKATLIAQPQTNVHIVHTQFEGMFLIAPREMVTRSQWQQDRESLTVTIDVSDASDEYNVATQGVLMTAVAFRWTITPLNDKRIRITYQGYADPAGRLPDFIARKAALRAMKKTLAQLPQALENYPRAYTGIVEP
ncbi:hypothetical protein CWI80_09395 [Pseudidiomarina sediminum]|uniref:START domain-containing protein n=2 Tax=Pseudidiomarina sediminum TaxID=431675 RepID=A0A432Z2D9_9GAMM|nr:hypothetical protein CWI80_09395 [Pseudidiomarina sediminum]